LLPLFNACVFYSHHAESGHRLVREAGHRRGEGVLLIGACDDLGDFKDNVLIMKVL
jgi:hypothetical protein